MTDHSVVIAAKFEVDANGTETEIESILYNLRSKYGDRIATQQHAKTLAVKVVFAGNDLDEVDAREVALALDDVRNAQVDYDAGRTPQLMFSEMGGKQLQSGEEGMDQEPVPLPSAAEKAGGDALPF